MTNDKSASSGSYRPQYGTLLTILAVAITFGAGAILSIRLSAGDVNRDPSFHRFTIFLSGVIVGLFSLWMALLFHGDSWVQGVTFDE